MLYHHTLFQSEQGSIFDRCVTYVSEFLEVLELWLWQGICFLAILIFQSILLRCVFFLFKKELKKKGCILRFKFEPGYAGFGFFCPVSHKKG